MTFIKKNTSVKSLKQASKLIALDIQDPFIKSLIYEVQLTARQETKIATINKAQKVVENCMAQARKLGYSSGIQCLIARSVLRCRLKIQSSFYIRNKYLELYATCFLAWAKEVGHDIRFSRLICEEYHKFSKLLGTNIYYAEPDFYQKMIADQLKQRSWNPTLVAKKCWLPFIVFVLLLNIKMAVAWCSNSII